MGGEFSLRQTGPQQLGLAAAVGGERRVQLTLDPMVAIPRRLAVANEKQARRSGTRW
jgi:hypothetical protein